MEPRIAFVDDCQAAKDFATGDLVRRMGYRELLPGPFVGKVIYSNPNTGKVHVQWPWGNEEESATELIRDTSCQVPPNNALDQIYPTWESARHITDEDLVKDDEKWIKGLIKDDPKWRKQMATELQMAPSKVSRLSRIIKRHEEECLPIWRAACKAWYQGMDEISAFKYLATSYNDQFTIDTIRLTIANLYGLARNPPKKFALYWKGNNRKYKVTRREKRTGKLTCPRCRHSLKPRTYRHQKRCLQCRGCGFCISPKDLVWDTNQMGAPGVEGSEPRDQVPVPGEET